MKKFQVSPDGSLLVYKKGYSTSFIESTIKENNLRGLRIFAQLKEDRLKDLNFLEELTFLEVLWLSTADDYDFRFLENLINLQELSIGTWGNKVIDLSPVNNLRKLYIHWRKSIVGLNNCQKLETLT